MEYSEDVDDVIRPAIDDSERRSNQFADIWSLQLWDNAPRIWKLAELIDGGEKALDTAAAYAAESRAMNVRIPTRSSTACSVHRRSIKVRFDAWLLRG